jgi:FkbM family methyltransferase
MSDRNFTLRLAKLVEGSGIIVAVGPVPVNVDRLEENLRVRGLASRCVVRRTAVGSESGRLEMERGDHSTTWSFAFRSRKDTASETVDVCRLDDLLCQYPQPSFIKVDIEGAETDLVAGAPRTITEVRPLWLFEMHSAASWTLAPEFISAGYRAFDLHRSEIAMPLPSSLGQSHVVFCPAEKMHWLGESDQCCDS